MKKNRKLWIVSAALVAVVLVAVLCLLLPRLQVEPGVPKSGAPSSAKRPPRTAGSCLCWSGRRNISLCKKSWTNRIWW